MDLPYLSVKNFYKASHAQDFLDENPTDDEVDVVDVVELPPPVSDLTDEEDFDDDVLDNENSDPTYLLADVVGTIEIHQGNVNEVESSNADVAQVRTQVNSWEKCRPSYSKLGVSTDGANMKAIAVKEMHRGKNPVQLFEIFFTEDLLLEICRQSVLYSTQKNKHDFALSTDCLRNFIGILFFTGYHKLPSERHYWSLDEDMNVAFIRSVMPRHRFLDIKRYLHLIDNTHAPDNLEDRSFKVRPLMDHLNQKFKQFGIFSKELSIDEQMVRYYGRHSLKQFIRGKPIRFGFKQWIMCCGITGYCYSMELYQGKKSGISKEARLDGLGSRVVKQFTAELPHPADHEIYIDNFFTSHKLLSQMTNLGVRVTGTTRANRTGRCPLLDDKAMKKEERGMHDYCFDGENEVLFVKWYDNSCVTMGTNHQKIDPLTSTKRWSSASKKEVQIPQPHVISSYNKFMGGVDKLDWLIQKYRIAIRSKKCYFPLLTNCLDIAATNAWILYNAANENNISLLDFKRSITRSYLHVESSSAPKYPGRPKLHAKVFPALRYSPLGHFRVERTDGGKQRKCAVCKKNVRKQCIKCNVGIHLGSCEKQWHKN